MNKSNDDIIPGHESPVRRIFADSHGEEYHSIKTFNEAKEIPNAYVIFEGDYGGQIYLTCPVSIIKCNEKKLKQLLVDIDTWCWAYEDSTGLFYEPHKENEGIAGGMGGGMTLSNIWFHPELIELGLDSQIKQVLGGKRDRINMMNS